MLGQVSILWRILQLEGKREIEVTAKGDCEIEETF